MRDIKQSKISFIFTSIYYIITLQIISPPLIFKFLPTRRYDATGFIVGDVQVEGSILCFGDIWLAWSARTLSDLSLESLTFVDLVKPPPELIVLGCGHAIEQVPQELLLQLKERDIAVEAMDTVNAVATFNILNQEGRKVVGAMLPASVGMATSVEE